MNADKRGSEMSKTAWIRVHRRSSAANSNQLAGFFVYRLRMSFT